MEIRTHHKESLVIFLVLVLPFFFTQSIRLTEAIAVAAVFFTFQHAQIADRLQEQQAAKDNPEVECYWKSNIFFMLKEAFWILFFVLIKSWAALSGAVIFFMYPFWRKYYRSKNPVPVT